MFFEEIQTNNQQLFLRILKEKQVELWIKREDEIHEFVSGNKYRKLKYNIEQAKLQQKKTILTFGGAFSNHIVATAVAGKLAGLHTIGVIRGEELANNFEEVLVENNTLKEAYANRMQFKFIDRVLYREKHTTAFLTSLEEEFDDFYVVPEGGTNTLAIKGCQEILADEDEKFDYICAAVGTGGTISGLINSSFSKQKVIGFPALKGDFLSDEIKKFTSKTNWNLQDDYIFGGYAKFNADLIRFINQFKEQTNIQLDPIYTGKMLFGIIDMIKNDFFKKGTRILAIHTGGLQGIDGINKKLRKRNLELIE